MRRQTRRRFVAATALAVAGVAGCAGRTDSAGAATEGASGGSTESGDTEGRTTGSGDSIDSHPAAAGLDAQPTLGPREATATIVAFEDPSCPRCRAFERNTVPRIRDELVATGSARFVART